MVSIKENLNSFLKSVEDAVTPVANALGAPLNHGRATVVRDIALMLLARQTSYSMMTSTGMFILNSRAKAKAKVIVGTQLINGPWKTGMVLAATPWLDAIALTQLYRLVTMTSTSSLMASLSITWTASRLLDLKDYSNFEQPDTMFTWIGWVKEKTIG